MVIVSCQVLKNSRKSKVNVCFLFSKVWFSQVLKAIPFGILSSGLKKK